MHITLCRTLLLIAVALAVSGCFKPKPVDHQVPAGMATPAPAPKK